MYGTARRACIIRGAGLYRPTHTVASDARTGIAALWQDAPL